MEPPSSRTSKTRQIKGEDKLYLVLRIVGQTDLVVRVPACNLDLVGVRDVVDADGLERVFGVLRAPHTEEPTNWSRRYKANLEKLHSGNVLKVAEVVRDLWRRERERGLSAGEKRMLAKARQILVSELARRACRGRTRRRFCSTRSLLPDITGTPSAYRNRYRRSSAGCWSADERRLSAL